ncbi:hypothetical protein A0H81_09114 [Grifola frondosa]|uniref:Transmembrane protein n=1 Tax=Grifola frondosa TaxID=5627 RepID=A0A1C7M1U8_GRIFR|nr:hypothetical protein A0H81_09114 [Grifola frondosa]
MLVILTFIDSWAFLFSTGVLIHGAGMELNITVCSLGVFSCIVFYASSKIMIYLYLIEKVHVVWSPISRVARLKSLIYLGGLSLIVVYVGVGIILVCGRITYFRDDGSCVIGLTRHASLVLLVYDLLVNILLTSLFLLSLSRARFRSVSVRRVAVRTVWAAAVALTTSCINILILTLMHGHQLGWICLGSCGTDVVVNAVVLFWVSTGSNADPSATTTDPQGQRPGRVLRPVQELLDLHPSKLCPYSAFPEGCAAGGKIAEDLELQPDISDVEGEREVVSPSTSSMGILSTFQAFTSIFGGAGDELTAHEIQVSVTTELNITFDDGSSVFPVHDKDSARTTEAVGDVISEVKEADTSDSAVSPSAR